MSSIDFREMIAALTRGDGDEAQAGAAFQALHAVTLDHLVAANAKGLEPLATALVEAAGKGGSSVEERSPGYLAAWLAGHLQALLSLVRLALVRRAPHEYEAILLRKRVPQILRLLARGDRTLSAVADEVGMDPSYAEREVNRMAAAQMVRTAKKGRERWISLTASGLSALRGFRVRRHDRARTETARLLREIAASVSHVSERQQKIEHSFDDVLKNIKALQESTRGLDRILVPQKAAASDPLVTIPGEQESLREETGYSFLVSASLRHRPPVGRRKPWHEVVKVHRIGEMVLGVILKVTEEGADVDLGDGSGGYMPRSEFPNSGIAGLKTAAPAPPSVGQIHRMTIIRLDPQRERLILSVRQGHGVPRERRKKWIVPNAGARPQQPHTRTQS